MKSKGQQHRFNRIHLSGSAAYFIFSYFLNNILSQEGVRAYWCLLFNLPLAPSLHQLTLLSFFWEILYLFILPSYRLDIIHIHFFIFKSVIPSKITSRIDRFTMEYRVLFSEFISKLKEYI